MGCPNEVQIGDSLVFSVCCHDPDTGILTDADSSPSYRVYENETATPILTGTMAKLDDANTTGFYTESLACTAANGFDNAKTYTIYITATVDGDTGGTAYNFKAYTLLREVGYGAIAWPFTVTQTGGAAVAGAEVWATTDSDGQNVVEGVGSTDANGLYTFHLDAGTYWFWAQHSGLNAAGVQETVA